MRRPRPGGTCRRAEFRGGRRQREIGYASCTRWLYNWGVKSLNVSEFREQCLSMLDKLPPEGIVITRRGRPVARILPVRQNNADLIGKLAGKFEIRGDIFSTGEEWDAES